MNNPFSPRKLHENMPADRGSRESARPGNRSEAPGAQSPHARLHRIVALGLLVLTVIGYGWIQTHLFTPGVSEPDSAAYVWMAERIGFGLPLTEPDEDVFRHQNHVWVRNRNGQVLPKYAPGYPALMGVAWRLAGEKAAFAVGPVAGGVALVAAFFLFRLWMSPLSAAMAVLGLGLSPMYIGYCGYVLSHGVDVAFITLAMALLWRWVRNPRVSTGVWSGLLLGMTPLLRPANVVLALTAFAAVWTACSGARRQGRRIPWLPILALGSSGLVFPLLLLRYHLEFFGSPWISGYALSNEQFAFDGKRLLETLVRLPAAIHREGLPLVFGTGLAGLFIVGPPGERWMRWAWILPLVLLYAAYYWAPMNASYLRFLLGTFPVFVGVAFAWIDDFGRMKGGRMRWLAPLAGVLALGIPNLPETLSEAHRLLATENATIVASAEKPVSRRVAEGTVVLAEPPLSWFVPGVRNARIYNLYAILGESGERIRYNQRRRRFEPRWDDTRRDWILSFYETHGSEAPRVFEKKLLRMLENGTPVVLLCPRRRVERWLGMLGPSFDAQPLEHWTVPPPKSLPWGSSRRRGRGGTEWSLTRLTRSPPQNPESDQHKLADRHQS